VLKLISSSHPIMALHRSGAMEVSLIGLDLVALQPFYPLPSVTMKDDSTKADLQAMEERILKAIASLDDVMQRQFHFVAEMHSDVLTRLDAVNERLDTIDDKLDGERKKLLTDVHAFVGEDHATVKDHTQRLERLERQVGIAA